MGFRENSFRTSDRRPWLVSVVFDGSGWLTIAAGGIGSISCLIIGLGFVATISGAGMSEMLWRICAIVSWPISLDGVSDGVVGITVSVLSAVI